ncbi:hypothetical protein [Halorussus marinus]|uniref:hypothetical protein n=1 Tax=Halorussus marinus TaxID=2505976 RepID=UPI00106DDA43|nr:hypothetical protein [Halorussus marinus]
MIEWLGGEGYVVDIAIPLFGILLVGISSRVAETNGSERYVFPAFCCWLGYEVLLGLEAGTLVALPRPLGPIGAVLLLVGFLGLLFRGLYALWKVREPSGSSA